MEKAKHIQVLQATGISHQQQHISAMNDLSISVQSSASETRTAGEGVSGERQAGL